MPAKGSPSPGFFGPRRSSPEDLRQRRGERPGLAALAGAQRAPSLRTATAAARQIVSASTAEEPRSATSDAAAALTPEHRLVQRTSFGATLADLSRMGELGYEAYLGEQLAYTALDDSELEGALAENLPTLALSPAEIYADDHYEATDELTIATLYRALYSPCQLFEVMCTLWSDHFNIDLYGDSGYYLMPAHLQDVIRGHALGSFPAMLKACAKSPAMLVFLTNEPSSKEHPNQNYARELMELHTLGADNGYTQRDVEEVARCLTGWSVNFDDGDPGFGRFRFDPDAHDDDAKVVLGHRIPAGGGITDGETVLDILATHPNTAKLVSRKILRHLWGYEPPAEYVDRISIVYLRSGGSIRSMVRAVLKREWIALAPPKLKRPFHYMVSGLRALFAGVDDPYFVLSHSLDAGHLPYAWSPPNGYPDARAYWSGFLLPRWNFSAAAIDGSSGVDLDLPFLDPALTPVALTRLVDGLLANGTFSETTRNALRNFLRTPARDEQRVREALGLALSSPEFQDF